MTVLKPIKLTDTIIYEDRDYLVINKWQGISTLSDRNDERCLLDIAREHMDKLQVCHRLDKQTSGVLVFAKHPEAYRSLSLQFQNREVRKYYHAIAEGHHDFREKVIDLPIYQGRRGHVRISHSNGKDAKTIVDTVSEFQSHTLLQCNPVTGRTHQIRVHLAASGAPIAGDTEYGGQELYLSRIKRYYNQNRESTERPLMARPALHARKLGFNSLSGESIEVEAEYPKDFRATLRQLEKIRSAASSWH